MRRFYSATLGTLALLAAIAGPAPFAHAQGGPNDNLPTAEQPEEAPSKGDPLYGYVLTGFLSAGIVFAVCKSSRR